MYFSRTTRNIRVSVEGDCTILYAMAQTRKGEWLDASLNLDRVIGNDDGWFSRNTNGFTKTAKNIKLESRHNGSWLTANLTRCNKTYKELQGINLDLHITNNNGKLVWDLNDVVTTLIGDQIMDMAFSKQQGLFFFGSSTGDIFVSSLDQLGSEMWATHASGVEYLHVIPDANEGDRLISLGYDGSVMIWKIGIDNLRLMKIIHGFHSVFKPCLVPCRPTSNPLCRQEECHYQIHNFLVFATDDGALNWWDLDTYTSHATLLDGMGAITAMDIDTEEDLIAAGCANGEVKVWRLSTLAYILHASTPGIVTKVRFLPSGNQAGDPPSERRLAIMTSYEKIFESGNSIGD
ncbi:WD40-repeat-containing domain protein [Xylogone sp. PMI_703]|nr:WD40-repeat-containing domain protein [Xylogone sp. PMI_703]